MQLIPRWIPSFCVAASLAIAATAVTNVSAHQGAPAAKAATKPSNATAQCKDGTYSTAKTQANACSKHGGVGTWYADTKPAKGAPAKAATTATTAPAPTAKTTPKPVPPVTTPAATPAATPAPKATTPAAKAATAAPAAKASTKIVSPPADAPKDAMAKCKDGTFSTSKVHSGACSKHGGVAEWYKS
jgi:uncharacterized protein with FMN-binding domain